MGITVCAQQREDLNLKGERARLKQGIQSREVTRGEARKVRKEMHDVQEAKADAKADGIITRNERKEIAREDRQLDRTIRRVKHNNRDRK
jgi:hypothetical protein